MKRGRRIKTLAQLAAAAAERRSVLVWEGAWLRRYPAAVVMNRQAACVHHMLDRGIFLNIPKRRIDTSKPPRKWIPPQFRPPSPPTPPPPLLLPYYPEIS